MECVNDGIDVDNITGANQNGADPWEAPDNGLEGQPLDTETKPLTQIPKSQGGLKSKAAAGTRNSFGDQVFPSDLAETGMDVIKFTMLEFKPRKITNQGALGKVQKNCPARLGCSFLAFFAPPPI